MVEKSRVAAGRALRPLAVVLVLAAAATAPAREKDRPPQRISLQALDALGRQYRDAGLPLPPANAPLMLAQTGVSQSAARTNTAEYVVGFKVPPAGDGNPSDQFLMGTQRGDPIQSDPHFPPMRPLNAAKGLPATVIPEEEWVNSSETFPVNNWLALAVQCHLRGYDLLAEQIFARGLARNSTTANKLTPLGDGGPRDALAATAWNHWMNHVCTEGSDRQEALTHLEKLSAEFPALDGPLQRDYVASLRLAMVPGTGAPDSVEDLVDRLVDRTGYGGRSSRNSGNDSSDPGYVHLQNLGFEAVPTLIAHLHDRRLTRSALVGDDGEHFYPRHLSEVVSSLIEDIAGGDEFTHDSPEQPEGQALKQEAVERWWAKASALGEEAYMTGHVFPPNEVSLQIVAERYPQRLGEMYARILKERPEEDCQSILLTIVGCGHLAREERRRAVQQGVKSSDLKCNFEAIGALLEFEPADADAALIEKLDHWPTDVAGVYQSGRPEAYIGRFVRSTDAVGVWQAFERALFRASTAFRMEMLKSLADNGLSGRSQDVRLLALLDLFLDDEEVRVIRKEDEAAGGRFEGYSLTAETRRISVRNFVAGLLSTLLDVKPPSGSEHDERWWAKYRASMRTAIDQRARAAAEASPSEEL